MEFLVELPNIGKTQNLRNGFTFEENLNECRRNELSTGEKLARFCSNCQFVLTNRLTEICPVFQRSRLLNVQSD